ncbi:MAG: DUF4469 domain-containing protein [Lentimicrobiaceae bacterium]|nr:DUF4469 domain-containing protein [Lentimicrobiaceae bacterium]
MTDRADDYSAITHSTGSLDKEEIITRMLHKGTLTTRTDIVAVMNNFEEAIEEAMLEGYSITYPLFNTSFSISGVFESPTDSFDGNRHKLNINLTKGVRLRETERKVKFEKTTAATPLPTIQEVKDCMSGKVNELLTKGGVVELTGYSLKIEGDSPSCGLWFINAEKEEQKSSLVLENKPSRIMAMIPVLAKGAYQIKIVTQFTGGGKLLKTPKTFIYPKILQVGD